MVLEMEAEKDADGVDVILELGVGLKMVTVWDPIVSVSEVDVLAEVD
jgi:hypothetical protein